MPKPLTVDHNKLWKILKEMGKLDHLTGLLRNMYAGQEATVSGSIPGSGRSPGGGHGDPLQYSCLENPRDSGAWWAAVSGRTESDATELT